MLTNPFFNSFEVVNTSLKLPKPRLYKLFQNENRKKVLFFELNKSESISGKRKSGSRRSCWRSLRDKSKSRERKITKKSIGRRREPKEGELGAGGRRRRRRMGGEL